MTVSDTIIDRIEPPFIDLHAATWTGPQAYELAEGARRFENYESHVAGRIGLARAVSYAQEIGMEAIGARVQSLAARLRAALSERTGVTVHDLGAQQCGIVTFLRAGEAAQATSERLRAAGINTSVSVRPYAQLDLGGRGLDALVRASVHYFNSEDEIERVASSV